MAQADLARVSGYSERLIRKAESGKPIAIGTIEILAEALSTDDRQIHVEDLTCDPIGLAKRFVHAWYVHQVQAVDAIADFLDEELIFEVIGDPSKGVPFAGQYHGPNGLREFFAKFFTVLEVPSDHDHSQWYQYFRDGQDVNIVGQSWIHPIGRPFEEPIDAYLHLKFRRGKLYYCRDLVDTQKGSAVLTEAEE